MLGTILLFSIGATCVGLVAWVMMCFVCSPEGYEDETGFHFEQQELPNINRDHVASPKPARKPHLSVYENIER